MQWTKARDRRLTDRDRVATHTPFAGQVPISLTDLMWLATAAYRNRAVLSDRHRLLRAATDGALTTRTLVGSLILGALLMASPIVLLKIKSRSYFRQDR